MILMLIFICVFIIGVLLIIYDSKHGDKSYFQTAGAIGFILTLIGFVLGIVGGLKCGFSNSKMQKFSVRNELEEQRTALIFRLETYNQTDDNKLFSDIAEFNTKLKNKQYYLNNPWVNWFTCPAYNEFETIDYNDYLRNPTEIIIKDK